MRISGGGSEAPALATHDSHTPQIGDVLDSRYQITGVLGSGGMGCVYLALHVAIQRPLALKLLHPEVGEVEEITKRFEREAFAIGRMDHPNCVKVSDFGKFSDGTFYMVLELLDGVVLFDLLDREHRVDWRRALHIGRHILNGLDSAHEAGIVHRDVKPENIILVKDDDDCDFAKILDFGIAKLMHEDAQPEGDTLLLTNDAKLTQLGATVGTPTYIAPEQAYGLAIDGRADLYSVSVMLYEMITGAPPFDADEVGALLRMHISSPVPSFAEVAPDLDVPEEVERLLLDGLQKKADDRIGTAKEYLARIDGILSRESVGIPTASGPRAIATIDADLSLDELLPPVPPASAKPKWARKVTAKALSFIVGLALVVLGLLVFQNLAARGPSQDEPFAVMRTGHEQVSKHLSIDALIAYEKAVSLDPALAKNKLMRANVEKMLERKSPPMVVDAALDLLGTLVSVANDKTASVQLVDVASSAKDMRRRQKAAAVAQDVGLGDQIDRLASYTLDLDQGATCEARKQAVGKLRALGDKRAIPALRKARNRPRGGLGRKRVNTNACLRASAVEAVRYLQRL